MSRKIVISSGKGGVGKTTVTANLGYALASLGERVVMIDVDFGLNNLDVVTGVENKILYDMSDAISGRCRVKQAIVQVGDRKNLCVMPSGNVKNSYEISGQQIKIVVDSLSSMFDFCLIDCPAGIESGFHRAVSCADEAIVVSTPNMTSLRDADKAISIIKSYKLKSTSLVINRARGDLMVSERMMMPKDVESLLKTTLIGVLPEEDEVFLSSGYTLPKSSSSYKAYKVLANNLIKNNTRIYDVTSKYTGFLGSIRRSLKKSI